jgi:choline dehydrogenase-like flavoprotein
VTASDQKWWLENTVGGQLARATGVNPFDIDFDAVDEQVEAAQKHHMRTYGRALSDSELNAVRVGAEARSAPLGTGQVIRTTAELVQAVNAANPGAAGWSYQPSFRRGEGVAMLSAGEWHGDPVVIERVQRAEAEKARLNEQEGDLGKVMHIGPPT